MLIHEPTTPLGRVDCNALTAHVVALPDAEWFKDTRRQDDFDVHAQTRSIILLFCDGWPEVRVRRGPGWDFLHHDIESVMAEVIERGYPAGGTVLRAMLAKLPAGARIARHRDTHPSFTVAHRIHVPLTTNPDVEFIVGTERVPARAHFAFELNNLMYHEVVNRGSTDRIHFIFDYAPPGRVSVI